MFNIKKLNFEAMLSLIFFLLMFYVTIGYIFPILNHLQFFSGLVQFEMDMTWGRQLAITQSIVSFALIFFLVAIVILRIRQILKK